MPYFERKPWQEAAQLAATLPTDAQAPDMDFAQAATAILDREKLRKTGADDRFRSRRAARPGGQAEISLSIAVDGQGAPAALHLSASDLVSASGGRIGSDAVSLTPNPLEIAPGGRAVLRIRVSIPRDAQPGIYAGTVTGSGTDPMTRRIEIEVA